MAPPNYEVLIWVGKPGLTRKPHWSGKGMDFGEGYGAWVQTGHSEPWWSWGLNFSAHRDHVPGPRYDHNVLLPFQPRLYNYNLILPNGTVDTGGPNYHPVSEYVYVRDFVLRRMALGNEPFFFEDIDAAVTGVEGSQDFSKRNKYICQLIPDSIDFRQDDQDRLIYHCNLEFKQLRGWPAPAAP